MKAFRLQSDAIHQLVHSACSQQLTCTRLQGRDCNTWLTLPHTFILKVLHSIESQRQTAQDTPSTMCSQESRCPAVAQGAHPRLTDPNRRTPVSANSYSATWFHVLVKRGKNRVQIQSSPQHSFTRVRIDLSKHQLLLRLVLSRYCSRGSQQVAHILAVLGVAAVQWRCAHPISRLPAW